jgi:hypothetical protein
MPSGPKHVLAGINHPSHAADGNFNVGPNDATEDVTKHFSGAGRFPGGGATGGATRTPGDDSHAVIRYQNDHDWDDAPIAPRMDGGSRGR